MPINANVTNNQITASVGETKIDVSVSGGVGPTGSSGTISVTAPITNAGTTTAANVGLSIGTGLSVSGGSLVVTPDTYATLVGGKVPAEQLPSYVDDVLEYANLASLPATGESGKIYVALNTGKIYRWSGSAYFEISTQPGNTDAVPEGSSNLYFTNARARNAFGTGTTGQVITWSGGEWTAATPTTYTLPTATASVLGGVKIGTGVTITDGVISVSTNYAAASHTHTLADITDAGTAAASDATDFAAASDFDQGVKTTDSPEFVGLSWGYGASLSSNPASIGWGGTRNISIEEGLFFGEWNFADATVTGLSYTDLDDLPTLGTAAAAATTDFATADHTHTQLHDRSHAITSTSDHTATAWRVFYSNGSGVVTELALGASGTVLTSGGTSAAPSFTALAASATTDTTNASNISSGTLAAARIGTHASTHQTGGSDAITNVVVSPSQITGNQNDYSPGTGDIVRLSSDAARNITGITAGTSGEVRVLVNVGSNTITLVHQSASSTAGNRFLVSFGSDYLIAANAAAVIVYDGTTSRWRVI